MGNNTILIDSRQHLGLELKLADASLIFWQFAETFHQIWDNFQTGPESCLLPECASKASPI